MDIEKVRELVKLVEQSGIEELEIVNKDTTIRIQKSPAAGVGAPSLVQMAGPGPVPVVAAATAPSSAAGLTAAPEAAADPVRARWKELRSPIVGTCYRAPAPTSPNFVNVGDHVSKGQPLCIIEAMKVMNEIEAEMSGTIREILIENGSPVEAEAVLFLVDPD